MKQNHWVLELQLIDQAEVEFHLNWPSEVIHNLLSMFDFAACMRAIWYNYNARTLVWIQVKIKRNFVKPKYKFIQPWNRIREGGRHSTLFLVGTSGTKGWNGGPKNRFFAKVRSKEQDCSQPHSPGWARVPLSSFFPQILINFSYFSSNFSHFLPHFGSPGGQLAHPGRSWLRHC